MTPASLVVRPIIFLKTGAIPLKVTRFLAQETFRRVGAIPGKMTWLTAPLANWVGSTIPIPVIILVAFGTTSSRAFVQPMISLASRAPAPKCSLATLPLTALPLILRGTGADDDEGGLGEGDLGGAYLRDYFLFHSWGMVDVLENSPCQGALPLLGWSRLGALRSGAGDSAGCVSTIRTHSRCGDRPRCCWGCCGVLEAPPIPTWGRGVPAPEHLSALI